MTRFIIIMTVILMGISQSWAGNVYIDSEMVVDPGSVYGPSDNFFIGYYGNGKLIITNTGSVYDYTGCIGYAPQANGIVTVTGMNSVWSNSSWLSVGEYGIGTMNINDSGAVYNYDGYVGYAPGSMGLVTVDGVGSTWINSSWLSVGEYGTGELIITNGGTVYNNDGYVGYTPYGTGTVTVTGSGSVWSNASVLLVGTSGDGTLNIEDGGTVYNTEGYVGYDSDSRAFVTGAGSTWINSSWLSVGEYGTGELVISNSGAVYSSEGYVGYNSGATGVVTITGSDSVWSNAGYLGIGDYGTGILNVEDGGAVYSSDGCLGYYSGTEGWATVAGSGSVWSNSADLYVGDYGDGTLRVTAGGAVYDQDAIIGFNSGATGAVTVNGAGSVWSNSANLYVGYDGNGTLIITNQGRVVARNVWVGAKGNNGTVHFGNGGILEANTFCFAPSDIYGAGTAVVHGAVSDMNVVFNGSSVATNTIGSDVKVIIDAHPSGLLGAGWKNTGSILISNGAQVRSGSGFLGYNSGSSGSAIVDGTNSVWLNYANLSVGHYGNGSLTITNGGAVYDRDAIIGFLSDATGTVTVDGADSVLSNSGDLCVGYFGNGSLTIRNNGAVTVGKSLSIGSGSTINLASGGTLDVAGDATLENGSLLGFELSDEEGSGKILVGGTIFNYGATIKLSSSDPLQVYSEYELIRAGDIDTAFETFDTNSVLSVYELSLAQTATNVTATIHGLKLQETDTPSVAKAFAASANVVMHNVSKYAGITRALLRGENTPSGPSGPVSRLTAGEWTGYMHQFNDLGGQKSEGALDGFDWQTSGYMAGVEKLVNPQLIIGFGAGQAWTDLDGLRGSGGGSTKMLITSLYGNWFNEAAYCEFGLLYARADNDTERIDTALDHYTGNYDSDMFGGWVEAGWLARRTDVTELEPYVRSTYISGHQDRYVDEGGPSPMTVSANGTDNWQVEGGARLSRDWELEDSKRIRLELKAGVQCELLDNSVTVNTEVIGSGQRVSSPEADRAAFILGARADLGLTDALHIGIGYEPTISGNWQNHLVDFMLKYEF